MNVIPAMDIKGGKCVQLVGGKPGTEKVSIDDVVGVARKWQDDGAEMIHIIDLDAALGTGSNEILIEKVVVSIDIPVQVGGGVRDREQVERYFDIGCERVIVGTRAIQDSEFIRALSSRYEEGIVVAIDSAQSEVLIRGWQESSGKDVLEVVRQMSTLPIYGFLYTNVEVEGRLQGIDPLPVQALLNTTDKPVIVSGGITTVDDLRVLREMGVKSAVVGMAIYTGSIDFRRAVRDFR
ncbi:MAG TPA: 1-(5-phosphoribosyl)-5-[(5-phosphoribosylamino)methylideneamino]imidazole-4-carboxamide isomerase [Thermoplasmata archaeon]